MTKVLGRSRSNFDISSGMISASLGQMWNSSGALLVPGSGQTATPML